MPFAKADPRIPVPPVTTHTLECSAPSTGMFELFHLKRTFWALSFSFLQTSFSFVLTPDFARIL